MSLPDPDTVEHIPPEAASTYAKLAATYGQDYYESVADELARQLTPGDRVLDVGTGPGFLPLALANRVDSVRIDAFDFTREFVQYGRKKAIEGGFRDEISFFVADCYNIPTASNSYTLLTCTGVLHSLDQPEDALTEFYRVIQRNGNAWVFDPAIIDVPDDPDIELTDHEQDILQLYQGRATKERMSVVEAEQVIESTPFTAASIEEGEQDDLRLYLGQHR